MVDPISVSIITKGLAVPGNTSGTEAAITTAAQTSQVASSMAKASNTISETNKANAAERTGFYKEKLRAPSRRNQKNFKTQQKDHSASLDTDWEFRGARSSNPQQVLRRPEQPSDVWSRIATRSEKLNQINRDFSHHSHDFSNNGLELNLAA
jgi:hypothetical protein